MTIYLIILVILVSGDFYSDSDISVEVLYANGTSYCTLPDLPANRYQHSQDGFLICGGGDPDTLNNCLTLVNGTWTQSHSLLHARQDHTSWVLGDGRVMLMGGDFSLTTTEIITPGTSTTTEGFTLKYKTEYYNSIK